MQGGISTFMSVYVNFLNSEAELMKNILFKKQKKSWERSESLSLPLTVGKMCLLTWSRHLQ